MGLIAVWERGLIFNTWVTSNHDISLQKRKEREAAILKNSRLTEDQRAKWLSVMTNDYMSSEESEEDDVMTIHPIPWRSEHVNQMFQRIDSFCNSRKSPQARRQMKQRTTGRPSNRTQPSSAPEFAVRAS